jgi:hypothetical protein
MLFLIRWIMILEFRNNENYQSSVSSSKTAFFRVPCSNSRKHSLTETLSSPKPDGLTTRPPLAAAAPPVLHLLPVLALTPLVYRQNKSRSVNTPAPNFFDIN